jgi:hypothetical protein
MINGPLLSALYIVDKQGHKKGGTEIKNIYLKFYKPNITAAKTNKPLRDSLRSCFALLFWLFTVLIEMESLSAIS